MNKKMFFAAASLSAALTGHLNAQNSHATSNYSTAHSVNADESAGAAVTPPSASEAAASTIHPRAIKDFKNRFANASDEHWSRTG